MGTYVLESDASACAHRDRQRARAAIGAARWLGLLAAALSAGCSTREPQAMAAAAGTGAPGMEMSPATSDPMPAAAGTAAAPPAQPAGGTGAAPVAGTGGGEVPPGGGAGMPAEPPAEQTPDAGPGEPPIETDAAVMPPVREDLGVGDGSDVITIGDSWMNLGVSGIEQSLRALGKRYRNYAVPGTTLAGSIPGQYDSAKRANQDIKTVIMTGGGNDIMFSGGCNTAEACAQSVMMITMRLNALWTTMSNDGVKDVIYINYSRDAGTAPEGTRPTEPPPPPAICVSGPIRCHSLQTTDLVMGQLLDGIHPTSAANGRIAMAVLDLMEMQGIRR
jgi:lysophospholipase L1-like esterase